MVVQKIKEIDPKLLKSAKGVMAVLELLGITEDDLSLIKDISEMKAELEELRTFKIKTERTLNNKVENGDVKPIGQAIKDIFGKQSKEFNPHYGR